MRITGSGTSTFLYINGLSVRRPVPLAPAVELLPAVCTPKPDDIIAVCKTEIDIGVAALFLRRIGSQLKVTASNSAELAATAWNALWDVTFIGAVTTCEAVCNLQCDTPAEAFGAESRLEATNYHLRGLAVPTHELTDAEEAWLTTHFDAARRLMATDTFRTAVHALASYRWHPIDRARMAILWAAIEGLFQVESEVVFRVSLYVARFLHPDDAEARLASFKLVKNLYKARSAAVHGAIMKGDADRAIEQSVELLLSLVRRCVEQGAIPDDALLAP